LLACGLVAVAAVVGVVSAATPAGRSPPLGWDDLRWDASGGLLDDEDLLGNAVDAIDEDQDPRVLFAGDVRGQAVVAVGVSDDGCRYCVVTVVDGEVADHADARPIMFDERSIALFVPLSIPDLEGSPYLFHPQVTHVRLGVGATIGDETPLELDGGVGVVPASLPDGPRACEPLVFELLGDRPGVFAVFGDRLSVGVRTSGIAEEVRDVVTQGVARGLMLSECDEPGRLRPGQVVGENAALEAEAGGRQMPVSRTMTVTVRRDDPLVDGRQGRVLWLDWRQAGNSEPDTATAAWQDETGFVYFGQPRTLANGLPTGTTVPLSPVETSLDGLAGYRIETATGDDLVIVASSTWTDVTWTADPGGASVLAAEPNLLVVADPGSQRHIVTIENEAGEPLDAVVIGG
jgi:hypothetical protein